jgi:hypothetical protein
MVMKPDWFGITDEPNNPASIKQCDILLHGRYLRIAFSQYNIIIFKGNPIQPKVSWSVILMVLKNLKVWTLCNQKFL